MLHKFCQPGKKNIIFHLSILLKSNSLPAGAVNIHLWLVFVIVNEEGHKKLSSGITIENCHTAALCNDVSLPTCVLTLRGGIVFNTNDTRHLVSYALTMQEAAKAHFSTTSKFLKKS
jgi:hypothetical protein